MTESADFPGLDEGPEPSPEGARAEAPAVTAAESSTRQTAPSEYVDRYVAEHFAGDRAAYRTEIVASTHRMIAAFRR